MKLTRFQKHVLVVLRAIGPASYDQLESHCRQSRKAIRRTVYRLRCVKLIHRVEQLFDVTQDGKNYLKSEKSPPRKSKA